MHADREGRGFEEPGFFEDFPAGCNQPGNTGVGHPHYRPAGFDRAEHGHGKVLVGRGRPPEPGIVGGRDQKGRPEPSQRAGYLRKYRLETDEYPKVNIFSRQGQGFVGLSVGECSTFSGQSLQILEQKSQRQVLAEWHQMHLVGEIPDRAFGIHQKGAVIDLPRRTLLLALQAAHQYRGAEFPGQVSDLPAQRAVVGVLEVKGQGGLRKNDQIRPGALKGAGQLNVALGGSEAPVGFPLLILRKVALNNADAQGIL